MSKNLSHYYEWYKNVPILVTGGAGFIGSYLIKKLVQHKAQVTIIDDLSNGNLANLGSIIDKVKFINSSIENFEDCLMATHQKQIVFHMAAITSVGQCEQDPIKCYKTNVTGTANLLEACKANNVQKFVFSSSSAVYGDSSTICRESSACAPISSYGYSKLMGEILCKQYTSLYNLDTSILRYFNVYTETQSNNSENSNVISRFRNSILNNNPITIYGDGTQTRDFVKLEKIIEANIKLGSPYIFAPGATFNIASGKSISIIELIEKLKLENPKFNAPIKFKAARPGDIKFSLADIKKYSDLEINYLSNYFYNQKINYL